MLVNSGKLVVIYRLIDPLKSHNGFGEAIPSRMFSHQKFRSRKRGEDKTFFEQKRGGEWIILIITDNFEQNPCVLSHCFVSSSHWL